MRSRRPEDAERQIELKFDLDAPPEKVWRAISIPEYREKWLPGAALADPSPELIAPGEALRFRLREDQPPFEDSAVTLRIAANPAGGTWLTIVHERMEPPVSRSARDRPVLMLAA